MAKKQAVVEQQITTVTPIAVKTALADQTLVLGAKQPKHRVGHTSAAWAAIVTRLPAKASELAALPELKVVQCGGPKQNGALFLGYAIRRGWLMVQS